VFIERSFVVSTCFRLDCSADRTPYLHLLLDVRPQRIGPERPGEAQGPRERPPALGEIETVQVEVQGRSPARLPAVGVGHQGAGDLHDSQQDWFRRSGPAAHAGAHRRRTANHRPV